ncbi:hypothetical protein ScPMuIL_004278 [Solemya velum]
MAASMEIKSYSESFQTLLQLYNEVEKQKIELESHCKKARHLFKPWPVKNNHEPEQRKEEKQESPKEVLSKEEEAELIKMEKLISKANRLISSSKVKDKRPTNSFEISPDDFDEGTGQKDQKLEDICVSLFQDASDKKMMEREIKTSLKQMQTEKKKKKNEIQESSINRLGRRGPGISVSNTSGNRCANSASRRGRRHIPVHMSAPFATNLEKSAPRVQTTTGSAFKNRVRKTPASIRQSERKTHRSIKKDNSLKNSTLKNTSPDATAAVQSSISESGQRVCSGIGAFPEERGNEQVGLGSCEGKIKAVTKGLGEITLADGENDKATKRDEKKKQFCLYVDGAHLKIPGKLKKLAHSNHRLRQKLYVKTVTTKVDSPPSDQSFVHKVTEQFYVPPSDSWSRVKTCVQYRQAFVNLKLSLDDLNLQHISESSTVYDMLRAKKFLEFILTTYAKLEDEQTEIDRKCVAKVQREYSVQETVNKADIFPHSWHTVQPGTNVNKVIQYKSPRQLKKYISLLFDIQYCHLQLAVMDTVYEEIVPILENLDPKSSEFVETFCAAYSLLSAQPHQCPTILKDTIQELEDSILPGD